MKQTVIYLSMVLVLAACKTTKPSPNTSVVANTDVFAKSDLEARSGSKASGVAWFAKRGEDIEITITVSNASPGEHGIHLHEVGDCSAADASSAGEHFNPAHLMHGQPEPQTFHMGDLGNITVDQSGSGTLNLIIPAAQFHPSYRDWSIIIGKSIVLHETVDDLINQPDGNSGHRIACGVITSTSTM